MRDPLLVFRRSAADSLLVTIPTADAVGYRSFAALRLTSTIVVGN